MFGVLARNPRYRLLWSAQAISLVGDWLNRVAILALLSSLAGGEAALKAGLMFGIELAVRMAPTVFFGSLAGALADRVSRRALMIGSDLLRAVIVLGFLTIDQPHEVPLLYGLLIAQMSLSIFFQAARSAAVPATVAPEDLARAYELAAITWSVVLSFGALIGGVLATYVGLRGVFICDALTYLVSAAFLWRLRLPPHEKASEPFRWAEVLLWKDLARGLRHARENGVVWGVFAKSFWGPAGGYLVLLPVLASRHVIDGDEADLAWFTGLYLSARGVGTGFGPVLVRKIWGSRSEVYRGQVAGGFFVAATAYAFLPWVSGLAPSLLLVLIAHMGGSAIWVGSTTLWQAQVQEAYRGRIFSAEFAGMTASFAVAGLLAGAAYDWLGSWEKVVWGVSAVVALCACGWIFGGRHEARAARLADSAAQSG